MTQGNHCSPRPDTDQIMLFALQTFGHGLFCFARRCFEEASARDLVQQMFLEFLVAVQDDRPKFLHGIDGRDPEQLKTVMPSCASYLFRIMRCLVSKANSRRNGQPHGIDGVAVEAQELGPSEVIAKQELIKQIRDVLDQVSSIHRTVLELAYLAEHSEAQIAEILGIPTGTVKSRLSRARKEFKKLWNRTVVVPSQLIKSER